MNVELTDDQRLIKRGRSALAVGLAVLVAIVLALMVVGYVTEQISDITVLVAFLLLAFAFEAGAVSWALWLLLSRGAGQEAPPTRRNEALRLLVTAIRMAVLMLVLVAFATLRAHHSDALLPLWLGAFAVLLALGSAGDAVKRRYPALPTDVPSGRRQEPVASWAGWYPDPDDRRVMRYWDGAVWTPAVYDPRAPTR